MKRAWRYGLPQGTLVVWKKACYGVGDYEKSVLIKLEVPADAHAILADISQYGFSGSLKNVTRKCRCSKAKVLGFYSVQTWRKRPDSMKVFSNYAPYFQYKVGTTVKPERPFSRKNEACESGIHFFQNKEDAGRY